MQDAFLDRDRSSAALISALGNFAASIDLKAIPDRVRTQARLCVLDTIGCMVAGADSQDVRGLIAAEKAGGGRAEASVVGTSERLSAPAAARLNGYLGDVLELNDLIGGHASISNVSAALAFAEARGRSGSELLRAVIAGIETTARVHAAFRRDMKPYTEVGIAAVGFLGTLGSAAAAASLAGLDARKTGESIAIAGALSGWCPAEAIFRDGGSIKPMLFGGWPASIGILAAQYAGNGLTGPKRLLEGDLGFFATAARRFDPAEICSPGKWHLAEPRRKIHACCGYIHSPIDLVAKIRREKGKDFFKNASMHFRLNPMVVPAVSKEGLPRTPNEARFHGQYCIALAADGADIITPAHSDRFETFLGRDEIRSLIGRIRVSEDPRCSHYQESELELTLGDGTLMKMRGDAPKGFPSNPMTDDEVVEKFVRLTEARISPAGVRAYVQRVQALDGQPDCDWLLRSFTSA